MVKETGAHPRLARAAVWCLAVGSMGGTLLSKWLNFPLSKSLRGMHYRFGPFSSGPAHFEMLSFGCAAAGLIFAGAVAFHARRWQWLALIGMLLIWLTFYGGLKATLTDARLLQALSVEFTQQKIAFQFSLKALPVNYGAEPTVWSQLDVKSVLGRLITGWYFLHLGWWAALIPGILAVGYGTVRSCSPYVPWCVTAGVFGLLLACSLGPAGAELSLHEARRMEAEGNYEGASNAIRRAMALDGWQAFTLDNYATLGALDAARGRRDTLEYHIYHAELPSTQADAVSALAELNTIRGLVGNPLAEVIRKRESELFTLYARAMHSIGAHGAAVTAAENALERDPDSLLPAYYMTRDAYLVGHYEEAATLSARLLTRIDDPILRANLLSNVGDAYTQLGDHVRARLAYRDSYRYDYVLNLRALSALNGPGEDMQ